MPNAPQTRIREATAKMYNQIGDSKTAFFGCTILSPVIAGQNRKTVTAIAKMASNRATKEKLDVQKDTMIGTSQARKETGALQVRILGLSCATTIKLTPYSGEEKY